MFFAIFVSNEKPPVQIESHERKTGSVLACTVEDKNKLSVINKKRND
ncbi:conserved hypothetical protein [Bacillus altitudinis]|uniref:Uncharacterized protein n=1 Tax=Bacillus altitudinis TaxID=293387 RepID=A0A653UAY1_BACAB|nr:hypothetical protein BAME_06640 [Bacillus sp. M 2-6]KIL28803.1 hypothetical protein B4133_2670 [Bacillus altitudinis]SPR92916.1 conserved hypothetical protein [Bacillus altitudinis]VXB71022.1 hypothetical protein BACI9J_20019 [Bacillus altitudinis]VXB86702.1 hypothetical protein BACI348_41756 [Bacillus altitudinis]